MKSLVIVGVIVSAALSQAPAAEAQARPERPDRGLFGSGLSLTPQQLTLNASLGAGWDDNVLLGTDVRGSQFVDPRTARSGGYGIGSLGLNYTLQRGVFVLGASGVTTGRYYPGIIGSEFVSSQRGGANTTFNLGNTRVYAGYAISYQPYNLVTLMFVPPPEGLPDTVELPDEDLSISHLRYISNSMGAGVSHSYQLSERGALSFGYDYSRVDVATRDGVFWRHGGGVQYSHTLARGLSAHVGYRLQEVWYPRELAELRRVRAHNTDFGINFNRALSMSLSRRVTLTVSTGSTAMMGDSSRADISGPRFFVTGSAALNREVGRTWNARVGYNRGVSFLETFNQPFLYDAAYVSYGGLINRRTQFNARAGASYGNVGLSGRNPYEAYNGRLSLGFAVSRFVSAGVSYSYSRYRFQGATVLPSGSLSFADRHGVRASVTAFAPLFTRIRRSDAPG